MSKTKAGIGSTFDAFLKEDGIFEESQQTALLRVFAWKIREAMKAQSITKVEMAKRMQTSCSQLDRLPGPQNDRIELATLATCLLYTSPSPRDQRGSRMPSSA